MLDQNSFEAKFINFRYSNNKRNSKIENGILKHRIYFQFLKLRQTKLGLSLFEKIFEFLENKLLFLKDKIKENLEQNLEEILDFVDCALLDFYFY